MTRGPLPAPPARPEAAPATLAADPGSRVARLFLVDLCGASLSALLSGLVLPTHADLLGVTGPTLQRLAAVAVGLALIDAAYLVLRPRRWRSMLLIVAVGNFAYPLLALAMSTADGVAITPLGAALLGMEAVVVVALGGVQLRVARRNQP